MKKILVLTDMSFQGSGYLSISTYLFGELSKNYDVRFVGLGYSGEEHNYPFSIIPCRDINDAQAIVHNLNIIDRTSPDVIIVALDIPMLIDFHSKFSQYKKPFIGITPLENPPLTQSWTAPMFGMDFVFFISELGKQAAMKSGLKNVDHLRIGIDTEKWRVPTQEERIGFRKGMGIEDDEFVILTVADNQERKNLSAAMEISSGLKKRGVKMRHIIVTRVDVPFGWKLRDLALNLDINQEAMIMNKGMPQDNLWSLYAMSDVFLLTSKAEGLGLPVLEAMSCGVPVVGTDTGAIHELLDDGRGFLIPPIFEFTDVWGNSKRSMIDVKRAADKMFEISCFTPTSPQKARMYVEGRTWDIPAKQLSDKIEELTNEK